jgi:signal transduction histidine kinase
LSPRLNIRTKVIFWVVLFVSFLFGVVEYQHTTKFDHLVSQSEASRNNLLIETALPVLAINLSFGLHDANSDYLERIALQNANVLSLRLSDSAGKDLYLYEKPDMRDESEISVIQRPIHDNITQRQIGTIRAEFSNVFTAALKAEHRNFSFRFLMVFILFMAAFIYLLNIAFDPLKELLNEIKGFDPNRSDQTFPVSSRHDEVGIIENAFAQMAQRIREYNEERAELTRNLERKVRERTLRLNEQKEALLDANAMLEQQIDTIREQEEMLISQSRLAAMGEMMSMIAHQWRQPLATMSLMITDYEVRAMMQGIEPDERNAILTKITETLAYMSETVNDFQTYFKPNNDLQEAPVAEVIERAVNFTRPRLKLSEIDIEVECSPEITLSTYVNELVQVLVNLLNNAVDAIREHDPKRRWIGVESFENDDHICICISDSGGGIPKAIMDKVFEPYFSTKSKNGTGLGLYMAKMIVEKHGKGTISVENTDDGAKFIMLFAKMPQNA